MTTPDLLSESGKFKTFNDILQNYDLIADLAGDDVQRMLQKKGKIVAEGFDEYYRAATENFRKTMQKVTRNNERLKGIEKIYNFCSENRIRNAIAKVVSRISGQTENELDPNRKNSLAWRKKNMKYEIETISEIDMTDMELQKMSRTTLIVGLADLWEREIFNLDFDLADLENLCDSHRISLHEVVDRIEQPEMGMQKNESGHSQTFLILN